MKKTRKAPVDSPAVEQIEAAAATQEPPMFSEPTYVPRRDQCCNCKAPIGDKPKRQPIFADEGDTKVSYPWCAPCFFHVRAPKEPGRWKNIAALSCQTCGWESVLFGFDPKELPRCPRCDSPRCTPAAPRLAKK